MNYKAVNEHTVKDHNPLPNIQDAIERLHGKTLFSKFDIRWGYNNIRLHPEDKHKAAFKTPFGTYVPNVMYFGLQNAPPFFQRIMHKDFQPLLQKYPEELGNYMDDWWIATTSDKEGRRRHKANHTRVLGPHGGMFLLPEAVQMPIRNRIHQDSRMDCGRRMCSP